ncbi:MAG: ribosomal protein S18-alanine N-acetyltransferase [Clostridia bacterium]|nr:ribosomal protein S18-alanine N-acetyltransferase [Clostridia bacterium]
MTEYKLARSHGRDVNMISAIEKVSFIDPWSRDSIERIIGSKNSCCISAIAGDRIVGYGFSRTVVDECEILDLAVSPKYKRQGIGKAVLEKMLECARNAGAETAYLEVREGNPAAIALYEGVGFSVIGRRKNYYRYPTEDALIMSLKLTEGGDKNDNSGD